MTPAGERWCGFRAPAEAMCRPPWRHLIAPALSYCSRSWRGLRPGGGVLHHLLYDTRPHRALKLKRLHAPHSAILRNAPVKASHARETPLAGRTPERAREDPEYPTPNRHALRSSPRPERSRITEERHNHQLGPSSSSTDENPSRGAPYQGMIVRRATEVRSVLGEAIPLASARNQPVNRRSQRLSTSIAGVHVDRGERGSTKTHKPESSTACSSWP